MAEQLTMHLQTWQLVLGVIVAITVLASWMRRELGGLYRAAKRIEDALGVDVEGKTLRQNVTELQADVVGLQASLDNGIRSDIRDARRLAGDAAQSSDTAQQTAQDALRATNALRADLNVISDVILADTRNIWRVLREHLGVDRRQYDDAGDPTGS